VQEVNREQFEALSARVAQIEKLLRQVVKTDGDDNAVLRAAEVRAGLIRVVDERMQTCVTLKTNGHGGRIGVRSSVGQTVWVAGAGPHGGVVGLTDNRGRVGFKASAGSGGGSVILTDGRRTNVLTPR